MPVEASQRKKSVRCFFICGIFLVIGFSLAAQKNKKQADDFDKVFTKIELDARTDPAAWGAYLKKASKLPDSVGANIPEGVYQVNVQFIVDKYGNIGGVKAQNNPGYGLSKRAEKIISRYEGVWTPANQCGRAVTSYKTQVVQFVVKN